MAKSKILKELANNSISIEIALKRLLIILNDLNYEDLIIWVEKELNGYGKDDCMPAYREIGCGSLTYSGIKGTMMSHVKFSNNPMPFTWIPKKYMDLVTNNYVKETIGGIIEKANNKENKYEKDLTFMAYEVQEMTGIACTAIKQTFDSNSFLEIINKISVILMKVFIRLDKEFGNLDELDIDVTDDNKVETVKKLIYQIIFIDNSIKIGDNNKIEKSNIGENNKNE